MLYTVLVVDDETDQRLALIERVRWQDAGFEVVGDAENGIEALELVEKLEPDLILSDIRMPLMTGLELARQVRELRPATRMVILSGYDDFEYARQALEFNVISYLLKPISSDELTAELHKIRASLDSQIEMMTAGAYPSYEKLDHRLKKSEFLLPLLLGSGEDVPGEQTLLKVARELNIIPADSSPSYGVIVSKYTDGENNAVTNEKHIELVNTVIGRYLKTESFFVNGRIVTLAICENGDFARDIQLGLAELVQDAKRIFCQTCTVGVSRTITRLSQCSAACSQAITARRYTKDGAGNIRFIEDQEHGNSCKFENVEKSVYTLENLLKVGSKDKIESFINEIYDLNNKESLDYLVIQILATAHRAVSVVSQSSALTKLFAQNPVFTGVAMFRYENNFKSDLLNLCLSARDIISSYQKHETELLCDRVVAIIEEEYGNEELSLTYVSAKLSVSPNYLSSLIKKTKKKNFITLVTEQRMKVASDLLLCTSLRVLEISEKCGYSDQHYFSYCFKKYFGKSPNQFRESKETQI